MVYTSFKLQPSKFDKTYSIFHLFVFYLKNTFESFLIFLILNYFFIILYHLHLLILKIKKYYFYIF